MQGVQDSAIAGQNTYIQSKNRSLLIIRLADENGELIPGLEGLVEAIEEFELKLKTDLRIAACMMSMNDGSSLIKILNLINAPEKYREVIKQIEKTDDRCQEKMTLLTL